MPTVSKMLALTRDGVADVTAGCRDDDIAAPAQILAALGVAEACGAREQHHRGEAAGADEDVELGAADADRAGRRHDLIGFRLGLAADPAERAASSVEREFVEGLGVVVDEAVDDDGGVAADGEFGAVAKPEFAEPAVRRADALVAINRRPDGDRAAAPGDGRTNKRGLADLLLRVAGNEAADRIWWSLRLLILAGTSWNPPGAKG